MAYENVSGLEPDLARSFLGFALALADTKLMLGRGVSWWTTGAPALEAAVASAAITQEELGHARALYSLLRELPDAPREIRSSSDLKRERFYSPALLSTRWTSWHQVVALLAVIDPALTAVFEAASDSSLQPLAQRAAKVLQEERQHQAFTRGWVRRLAAGGEESRRRLQQALDPLIACAGTWFGPPREPGLGHLVEAGILARTGEELRAAWQERLAPLFEKNGLQFRGEPPSDWSHWSEESRETIHD